MKVQNANPKNRSYIKSALLIIALLFVSVCGKAQNDPFPFKAGSEAMAKFFRDSIAISPDMMARKATGTVVLKFSADADGGISRMIVYYADDVSLVQPVIDAVHKSNHQWQIPANHKLYDYLISFTVSFNLPDSTSTELKEKFYKFYSQRRQITANNEVPLGQVTLLPNVVVKYDVQ
ncbi:MAG: hypothetical protein ACTHNW_00140 [Mucilaginibacter sp.]